MSWKRKRSFYDSENRVLGNLRRMTRHHVPPQFPDPLPRTIRVDERHHRAYHLIFGNARNLEDCIKILKRDWWK